MTYCHSSSIAQRVDYHMNVSVLHGPHTILHGRSSIISIARWSSFFAVGMSNLEVYLQQYSTLLQCEPTDCPLDWSPSSKRPSVSPKFPPQPDYDLVVSSDIATSGEGCCITLLTAWMTNNWKHIFPRIAFTLLMVCSNGDSSSKGVGIVKEQKQLDSVFTN